MNGWKLVLFLVHLLCDELNTKLNIFTITFMCISDWTLINDIICLYQGYVLQTYNLILGLSGQEVDLESSISQEVGHLILGFAWYEGSAKSKGS